MLPFAQPLLSDQIETALTALGISSSCAKSDNFHAEQIIIITKYCHHHIDTDTF